MYKVQDYKTRRSLRHHQQWLHMEYILYLTWYDIQKLVAPIVIS